MRILLQVTIFVVIIGILLIIKSIRAYTKDAKDDEWTWREFCGLGLLAALVIMSVILVSMKSVPSGVTSGSTPTESTTAQGSDGDVIISPDAVDNGSSRLGLSPPSKQESALDAVMTDSGVSVTPVNHRFDGLRYKKTPDGKLKHDEESQPSGGGGIFMSM